MKEQKPTKMYGNLIVIKGFGAIRKYLLAVRSSTF